MPTASSWSPSRPCTGRSRRSRPRSRRCGPGRRSRPSGTRARPAGNRPHHPAPLVASPAMARFGAVVTAMVTPFAADGAFDPDAAGTVARWLADHGSDGLVLAGTTGEGPVLTDDEKVDLWRAVAGAVTVPVVAGTGSNDTAHSIELTRRAAQTGVAGALVVCPYYNRPSQAGIEAHLRAVAEASELPVLIYDIPG